MLNNLVLICPLVLKQAKSLGCRNVHEKAVEMSSSSFFRVIYAAKHYALEVYNRRATFTCL